jgi:hypothetical protein
MTERKRKSKVGTPRTEVFAMRLDPKLKYLAEIAARKQRRSLANFMEWAIELGLKNTELNNDSQYSATVWDKSGDLWDVDDADRFAKLVFMTPELMTYDEQILWKVICETGQVWKGAHDSDGDWQWGIGEKYLIGERLRQYWNDFRKVASGEADKSILPKTSKKIKEGDFSSLDDDIPF